MCPTFGSGGKKSYPLHIFNGRFLKLAPARKLVPRYRRIIGTVDGCRTAGGRSSDGRRTVVSGARVVSGAEKKNI